ncbi:MAG: hypothetical protein CMH57_10910 [Myxococcales bacterium]|nr:hypothetical protein [Myxococcales bacterium]
MRWIPRAPAVATLLAIAQVAALIGCCPSDPPAPNDEPAPTPEPAPARAEAPEATWVGASRCVGCHGGQMEAWRGSDHAHAMAKAAPGRVQGDFSGASGFEGERLKASFVTEEGRLEATLRWGEGEPERYRAAYTFGRAPLQQLLVEAERGRLQVFPLAWDVEGARWFDPQGLGGGHPPGTPLHWRGVYANWNVMCADCHSTHLQKNYDAEADRYDTAWSEIHVGCEACHGPASNHVAWAEGDGALAHKGFGEGSGAIAKARQLEVCAPCHSRRQALTAEAPVGAPFLDHYAPELLREALYFPDGQIKDEVFVYGSFVQSRMHREGVVCGDCHDAHSGRLVVPEAQLCVRCHAPETYAVPAHHMHPQGSEGARCVVCHMPERTYMGVDPRRDHSIRIPRPDLSEALGTPNACAACHADEGAAWAAAKVADAHGAERPPHYGEAIAAARRGDPKAASALIAILKDADQAAIVRATAAELLAGYPTRASRAALQEALGAKEALIRAAAVEGALRWSPRARLTALTPLLGDPVRAVRVQAARALVDLGPGLEGEAARTFAAALDAYVAAQRATADHPGARLNLAAVLGAQGDAAGAEREYWAALKLDPFYAPAAVNLAGLLEGQGRRPEAEALLTDMIARVPDAAEAHYALGLLLAADERFEEAAARLASAAALRPNDARLKRNLRGVLGRLSPEQRERFEASEGEGGD